MDIIGNAILLRPKTIVIVKSYAHDKRFGKKDA